MAIILFAIGIFGAGSSIMKGDFEVITPVPIETSSESSQTSVIDSTTDSTENDVSCIIDSDCESGVCVSVDDNGC